MFKPLIWVVKNIIPALIAIPIVIWAVRDTPPTQVFSIEPVTRAVPPGGELILRFQGVRNRVCPVISTEEITDGAGKPWSVAPRLGNPENASGKFDKEIHIQIPLDANLGFATFESIAVYGVDFFRGCFTTHMIGPPERPIARFWIGDSPPWLQTGKR